MPKRPLALLGKALVAIKIDGADGVQHTPFALGETVSRVQCERLQPYGTGPATQQNAALVEESAAAADSLKAQAGQLVQAVAVFRVPGHMVQAAGLSALSKRELPALASS